MVQFAPIGKVGIQNASQFGWTHITAAASKLPFKLTIAKHYYNGCWWSIPRTRWKTKWKNRIILHLPTADRSAKPCGARGNKCKAFDFPACFLAGFPIMLWPRCDDGGIMAQTQPKPHSHGHGVVQVRAEKMFNATPIQIRKGVGMKCAIGDGTMHFKGLYGQFWKINKNVQEHFH